MNLCECPHCGQTMPLPLPRELEDVQLNNQERRILSIVYRAGKHGITLPAIADKLYADRDDGGPLEAINCISVTISRLNKKIRSFGKRVKGARGPGFQNWRIENV